jgi:peptide/nickel transport system substrate-binding protein
VAAQVGSPKTGGTLRFVTSSEPTSLDTHTIQAALFDNIFQVYDTLTAYDGDLTPKPRLAESWDISSDYKQIKLNLRKGVQYHDGREFTSDDVQWNFLRMRDPKNNSLLGAYSKLIADVATPDKSTVVLTFDQPRPGIFDLFAWANMQQRETLEGPDPGHTAVGTGPFKLVEYRQGQSMSLTKNPSYWESGKPYLNELQFTFSPDRQAGIVQLEAGAMDVMTFPPARDGARLQSDPRFRVLSNAQTSGQWWLVGWNVTLPPGDQKLVRQAVNYAIDRQRIADTYLLKQYGPAEVLPWPAHSPAYDAAKNRAYAFDLDKARALLKQAGVDTLEVDSTFRSNSEEGEGISQIIQGDLDKLGIKVTIRKLEPAAYVEQTRALSYKGILPAFSGFAAMDPASLFLFNPFMGVNSSSTGYKNDRFAQLVASAGTELDPAKRKQIYSDLNDMILDESAIMVLCPNASRVITSSRVHDVRWRFNEVAVWSEVWLDQ